MSQWLHIHSAPYNHNSPMCLLKQFSALPSPKIQYQPPPGVPNMAMTSIVYSYNSKWSNIYHIPYIGHTMVPCTLMLSLVAKMVADN